MGAGLKEPTIRGHFRINVNSFEVAIVYVRLFFIAHARLPPLLISLGWSELIGTAFTVAATETIELVRPFFQAWAAPFKTPIFILRAPCSTPRLLPSQPLDYNTQSN
jgi:hypothetical protein